MTRIIHNTLGVLIYAIIVAGIFVSCADSLDDSDADTTPLTTTTVSVLSDDVEDLTDG